jgi:hypothetical protein
MDRMRPMSEAPRDGTAVLLWWKEATYNPDVASYHTGHAMWLTDSDGAYQDTVLAGWTPIVRPLEPDAPEPEAQAMPPSMERATIQLFSAAQESVALRQPLAAFQALAGVAHAQAARRAARVGR